MYQMSCNRSAGTGENQIIWCGWAAAAGKRCGRAAGFPRPQSGEAASPIRAPTEPCWLLLGPERRGFAPVPLNAVAPVGTSLPQGPLGSSARLRARSPVRGELPSTAKPVRGNGMGRTAERSCMRGLLFPPGAGFRSLRTLLAGLAKGIKPSRHRCRRARPAPVDPGARRPRDARSESGTRQPGQAAPAEAAGCEQRGFRQRART